ncbi:hypothetical protein [Pseudomonas sp.]
MRYRIEHGRTKTDEKKVTIAARAQRDVKLQDRLAGPCQRNVDI